MRWALRGARARPVHTALLSGLCALVVGSGVFAAVFLRAIDHSVYLTQLEQGGSVPRRSLPTPPASSVVHRSGLRSSTQCCRRA